MDLTFQTEEGRFNYRACAVIISNNKLLAMQDCRSPYYYLPGGRVEMNETAENAVLRELEEELDIKAQIIRPLLAEVSKRSIGFSKKLPVIQPKSLARRKSCCVFKLNYRLIYTSTKLRST